MRNPTPILLGAALLFYIGFGPHPEEFGNMLPKSHFTEGPPIATYHIRQGDRFIYRFAGEVSLCDGLTCPPPTRPDAAAAKAMHLDSDLGPIDYSVPFSAWLPFYQSGVIEAKIPVVFTREGKKIGASPNGADIQADHMTVLVKVSRIGLIPLGHFDDRVEYVVLQGAKAGIARRIEDGNREIAAKILPAHAPGHRFYEDIRMTNAALDSIRLDSDPNLSVLDLWSDLTPPDGTIRKDLFTPDNIHLSPAGYAVYAHKLRPLLGGPSAQP